MAQDETSIVPITQWFPILAAFGNHQKLKEILIPGSHPQKFNEIGLGWDLGTGIFKSNSSVSAMQPGPTPAA